MKITFLGAASTVTGSKFLVQSPNNQFLVDCGMFQGLKEDRLKNWGRPASFIKELDFILLTHAHLDHSGYLPRLVNQGFSKNIYCTPPTKRLCDILLSDSAMIQEEEADLANREGFSKHKPALPLYRKIDVDQTMPLFTTQEFNTPFDINGDEFEFYPAGHILGASFIRATHEDRQIVFSGDLGKSNDPVFRDPAPPPTCDWLVMESTYGARIHEANHTEKQLVDCIQTTWDRQGSVVIPAFAVGRAQLLLVMLSKLLSKDLIPEMPIYVDSPMASKVSDLYLTFSEEHKLTKTQIRRIFSMVHFVKSPKETQNIIDENAPSIIVSASGMATGGRVLSYLKHYLPQPKNSVLFAGYQAPGTRGRRIVDGETSIKIHGQQVPIRAQVENLKHLSAHADQKELIEWVRSMPTLPKKIFLVHGEPKSSEALKEAIQNTLDIDCEIPTHGKSYSLQDK